MSDFETVLAGLRRIVTTNDSEGRSQVMIDGGPANEIRSSDVGGLFEIWHDDATGPLDGQPCGDQGAGTPLLSPEPGKVKIRWFSIGPTPAGAPPELVAELTRQAFVDIGAGDHQPDTSKHPAMHTTHTIDAIILVKGQARLILDNDERVIKPGDVVVQRATNHAWAVEGDEPALFVAVLVDRT